MAAPERLTLEPPLPEPGSGMLGVASAGGESRAGGCETGGTACSAAKQADTHSAGRPGWGQPRQLLCGAESGRRPELSPQPSAAESPQRQPGVPASYRSVSGVIQVACSGPHAGTANIRIHTLARGAFLFYTCSFKCKKGKLSSEELPRAEELAGAASIFCLSAGSGTATVPEAGLPAELPRPHTAAAASCPSSHPVFAGFAFLSPGELAVPSV